MKSINIRLPDDVHAKLTAMAEKDHRSANSTVIVLIEQEAARRDCPAP